VTELSVQSGPLRGLRVLELPSTAHRWAWLADHLKELTDEERDTISAALEAPVGVLAHSELVDPAAERGPAAPAAVGRGLPHVPQGVVRAAREHL